MTELTDLKSFDNLENAIARFRTRYPLEVGWAVNAVLDEALAGEQDVPKRTVYGAVLDQLADHFASTSDWDTPEAARSKLVDYARVGRMFPKARYARIDGSPKFSQLRACLTKSSAWWEYNESEIFDRVAWCEDNGWPSVSNIKAHFASSVQSDEALSPDDEVWSEFDLALEKAYNKAVKYLDASAALPQTPTIVERRARARKIVDYN